MYPWSQWMPIQIANRVPIPRPPVQVLASPLPAGAGILPIPYVEQKGDNWCWAACGEMLFSQHQPKAQCAIAADYLNLVCCLTSRAPTECDEGAFPDDAYPDQGLPTQRIKAPLSLAQIRAEVAAGKPVQVLYQWTGGYQTHVALIVGEHPNGEFQVLDPLRGSIRLPLDTINTAYGHGRWVWSFTF